MYDRLRMFFPILKKKKVINRKQFSKSEFDVKIYETRTYRWQRYCFGLCKENCLKWIDKKCYQEFRKCNRGHICPICRKGKKNYLKFLFFIFFNFF